MRLWFANDIPQSEENKVFKAKLNIVGSQNTKMIATNNANNTLWNKNQGTVTKIVFQDKISKIDGENLSWDISSAKNKTVMARLVPNADDTATNILYIQGNGGVVANYDSSYLFYNFSKLTEIENINLLDTSEVTNMRSMFYGCSKLTSLNVSNFNTSRVTNMNMLFYNCSSLISLDVSKFDTSNVTDMGNMFASCKITSLDVSNFDTSQVTSMRTMFNNCSNLTYLDLSSFITSNVTDMLFMFQSCGKLTKIDFRKATFDKVTSYSSILDFVPSNINIITKDETTKAWLEDKLGGRGTVTIA